MDTNSRRLSGSGGSQVAAVGGKGGLLAGPRAMDFSGRRLSGQRGVDANSSVLNLVDSLAVDDSEVDAVGEGTSPLHGLQEYFEKQFVEVQQVVSQTLSVRFEKASDLLSRRVKILRNMTKQNAKLQEENNRLEQELKALRRMMQAATTMGTPQLETEKPSGGPRRNSINRRCQTPPDATLAGAHRQTPPPGTGAQRISTSHSNGQRRLSFGRSGRSQTPTVEKIDGKWKSESAIFEDKGCLKNVMPVMPALPGHVTSNGGPYADDVMATRSTAASETPPPAPDLPSPVAPALANAAVLIEQGNPSSRTAEGDRADLMPRTPATNNFVKSESLTKDLCKDTCRKRDDGQLLVTDVDSTQLSSDGEAETPARHCSEGRKVSPKYASEEARYSRSPVELQWQKFSSEGRAGVDVQFELLKRSSVDKGIVLRHDQASNEKVFELKRSDSAPLEDIVPMSTCASPVNDDGPTPMRARTASILKRPGDKRAPNLKQLKISAPLMEYESGGLEEEQPEFSSSEDDDGAEVADSEDGEGEFRVLQVWSIKNGVQITGQQFRQDLRRRQSVRKMSRLMFDSTEMAALVQEHEDNKCMRLFIPFLIHPNSLKRGSWDLFSFILLIYDIFTIPFELFDPPHTSVSDAMIWTARMFWSLDMWFSCVTGYVANDGSIVLRPRAILMRYAKSWLLLDIVLVGLDWMELFWVGSTSVGFARLGKASRAFRILRMLRMLRVIRLNQVIQLIDERIRSDRLMIFADIMKIFWTIMGCAHFSACVWYGIGARDDERAWVKVHLESHHDLAYRYFLAMHWSLSQFAGGMDEVVPHNLGERVYAVAIWITAFMMAAVLTSSLTSEITRLQIISNQHAQQLSVLRRFLSDNGVSNKLSVRVQRNARHVLQQQQRYMREESVELLWLVSEPLRMELHFEIYKPLLSQHPFLNEYIEECSYVMRKVCHSCATITPVFVGDVIFNAGEAPRPPKMYFVVSGLQEYFTIGGNQVTVKEGMWLAEATLWTTWIHRGGLRVKMDSQLCEFSAEMFQEIVADSDFSLFDPRRYAEHFVKLLNSYQGGVSDLPFPRDLLEEAITKRRLIQSAAENEKIDLLSKTEVMGIAETPHG